MFIEKISRKEVSDFAKKYKAIVNKFHIKDKHAYVELTTENDNVQLCLSFYDFYVEPSDVNFHACVTNFNKTWRKIMYKKFGADYKSEFRNYMQSQVEELDML